MPNRDPGPSVKDHERYEALRRAGNSKEKSARIANTPKDQASKRGGQAPPYEEWTVSDLRAKARQVGIAGRSRMKKAELIRSLRTH